VSGRRTQVVNGSNPLSSIWPQKNDGVSRQLAAQVDEMLTEGIL